MTHNPDDLTPPHWHGEPGDEPRPVMFGTLPIAGVVRPAEPIGDAWATYRGWEVGYDDEAAKWSGEGWRAYYGGVDLDARSVSAKTFAECLDAVDDEEEPDVPNCQCGGPCHRCLRKCKCTTCCHGGKRNG